MVQRNICRDCASELGKSSILFHEEIIIRNKFLHDFVRHDNEWIENGYTFDVTGSRYVARMKKKTIQLEERREARKK